MGRALCNKRSLYNSYFFISKPDSEMFCLLLLLNGWTIELDEKFNVKPLWYTQNSYINSCSFLRGRSSFKILFLVISLSFLLLSELNVHYIEEEVQKAKTSSKQKVKCIEFEKVNFSLNVNNFISMGSRYYYILNKDLQGKQRQSNNYFET